MIGLLTKLLFGWPLTLSENWKSTSGNSLSPLAAQSKDLRASQTLQAQGGVILQGYIRTTSNKVISFTKVYNIYFFSQKMLDGEMTIANAYVRPDFRSFPIF